VLGAVWYACPVSRQCLFCQKPVDSAEHIWSDWILRDLKPTQPIRRRIGKRLDVVVDNPEVKVNCVCQKCNNEWMSDLETQNKPQISAMIHGKGIILEPMQQKLFARWAVLKAMIIESSDRQRTLFYDEFERKSLKPPLSAMTTRTHVWVGRYMGSGFHAGGTDVFASIENIPKALRGCVTTIVMGHLAVQVLTDHVLPKFATQLFNIRILPGRWDETRLSLWPVWGSVKWPPPMGLNLKGHDSIGHLVQRFKTGEDVG
jgi:hypothetical protein